MDLSNKKMNLTLESVRNDLSMDLQETSSDLDNKGPFLEKKLGKLVAGQNSLIRKVDELTLNVKAALAFGTANEYVLKEVMKKLNVLTTDNFYGEHPAVRRSNSEIEPVSESATFGRHDSGVSTHSSNADVSFAASSTVGFPTMELVTAKRPKVLESSKLVEIECRPGIKNEKGCTFEFELGQPNPSLHLELFVDGYMNYANLKASFSMMNNVGNVDQRRDFFIHISFIKSGQPTGVYKWFQGSTKGQTSLTNISSAEESDNGTVVNFTKRIFTKDELPSVYSNNKFIIQVKMIMKYYDNDAVDQTVPQPSSARERLGKMFDLKNHFNSVITLKGEEKGESVIINEILLRDCSPVFKSILDPTKTADEKPKEINVPYMTAEGLKLFYDYIHGISSGVWLNNIQLNLDLLKFAQDYMIAELIQRCTDNLINSPDHIYTIELVNKVGAFGETFEIPGLIDRVFEWIKNKRG